VVLNPPPPYATNSPTPCLNASWSQTLYPYQVYILNLAGCTASDEMCFTRYEGIHCYRTPLSLCHHASYEIEGKPPPPCKGASISFNLFVFHLFIIVLCLPSISVIHLGFGNSRYLHRSMYDPSSKGKKDRRRRAPPPIRSPGGGGESGTAIL
jgi:hypothetical protein